MSDEIRNKDDAKGRVKEAAGSLTGDDDLKREGKVDRASGAVKEVSTRRPTRPRMLLAKTGTGTSGRGLRRGDGGGRRRRGRPPP